MSYVVTDENRYIGEHSCERPHYGDQGVRREDCILEALICNERAWSVAFTSQHPAVRMLDAAINHLTTVERDEFASLASEGDGRGVWAPA